MNIIIVDDDRQAAEVLKKKLTEYHEMNVVGMAHDGKEGLHLFKEAMPDLLFLDIDMPDISGIDFLERVESRPGNRCRVIMYTAHSRYRLSGNLVGISINLCKSIQKELFINDTP